jgi:hypothetical protein
MQPQGRSRDFAYGQKRSQKDEITCREDTVCRSFFGFLNLVLRPKKEPVVPKHRQLANGLPNAFGKRTVADTSVGGGQDHPSGKKAGRTRTRLESFQRFPIACQKSIGDAL